MFMQKKKLRKNSAKANRRKRESFKRKWGVTIQIFNKIVNVVVEWEKENKDTRGRSSELTITQKVEITLMYWREYRTQFHISLDYGVSEATINRVIKRVENAMSQSGEFNLTGGKADLLDDKEDEIMIDVMECEIERPKKNRKNIIQGKRKSTP